MYITITSQKLSGTYAQSVADYVNYLEKENQDSENEREEHFFDQYNDSVSADWVVKDIDENTAKLKRTEPKFYSITVSPSQREMRHLGNDSEALKTYTREIMKDYARAFNREINGRSINVDDIKYYAKIEHTRYYKGTDMEIKGNQPFATEILKLKNQIRDINSGGSQGSIKKIEREIAKLEKAAPYQLNGKRIVQDMKKEGNQSHIHIIVSRKDCSNSISLSPGSKYKASTVVMHGKEVNRGFHRDQFFTDAEKRFDALFGYKRNFVETYQARKAFVQDPKRYFSLLSGLPLNEKALAYKILGMAGVPMFNIPTTQTGMAIKVAKQIKRAFEIGVRSASIGI